MSADKAHRIDWLACGWQVFRRGRSFRDSLHRFDALLDMKKQCKNDDGLFKQCSPDIRKLRAQARRERRLKARREWKERNL